MSNSFFYSSLKNNFQSSMTLRCTTLLISATANLKNQKLICLHTETVKNFQTSNTQQLKPKISSFSIQFKDVWFWFVCLFSSEVPKKHLFFQQTLNLSVTKFSVLTCWHFFLSQQITWISNLF